MTDDNKIKSYKTVTVYDVEKKRNIYHVIKLHEFDSDEEIRKHIKKNKR
jgi:hypothetical protein